MDGHTVLGFLHDIVERAEERYGPWVGLAVLVAGLVVTGLGLYLVALCCLR